MDEIRNPFAPGAGSQPPELAGRGTIINDAEVALQRALRGRHAKSQMLLGLRGTGKTVLLNRFERIALSHNYQTSIIEAPDDSALTALLYPRMHQVLRKLSTIESAKESVLNAMRGLRSFASAFKIKVGDVSIAVDPAAGVADSGSLEQDLSEMFVLIGEAAQLAGTGWALLIDEVQYLSDKELPAIIVAIHRVNQLGLPVVFFGAGLPQLAGMSGNAKSYAERLFNFPTIGPLERDAAKVAIRQPIEEEGESINDDALDCILEETSHYPYFLQEWGYQAWNAAAESPVNLDDVRQAAANAIRRLDESFFRVRLDRLTPKERDYVLAMAMLGRGPYRSADVAERLGENVQSLGPRRAQIISKGMIYSPAHGDIAFTVPMFDDFLRRTGIV